MHPNLMAFVDLPCSRSYDFSPMICQAVLHCGVVEKLGDGGAAVVYQAEDASPGRSFSYLACRRWCVFVLMVILSSGRLASQATADEQKPLHFDLTPLVGYRTYLGFPTGHSPSPHLVFGGGPSYGVSAGVRLDEENLIELRWARQNSDVHLRGSAAPGEEAVLDQFQADFTHEYILEEWPQWARPFVIGSAGATHIRSGTSSNFTRFSFGIGGGIKFYFTRHFGVRLQGEWLPLVVEPEVTSFVCGSGCTVHLSARLVSQGEIAVGPVFRF
jgi:hypothetical protein